MAKNVLQYVQATLSTMDSDTVTDIADTVEATQVANLLQDVYLEFCERQDWSWCGGGVVLTSLANVLTPTAFTLPTNMKSLDDFRYNVDDTGTAPNLRKLEWLAPKCFLERFATSGSTAGQQFVTSNSVISYWVNKLKMPQYYTSFDDTTIVCDAYKNTVETFLVTAKAKGFGINVPGFTISNSFTPSLPEHMVPLLQAELSTAAHLHFKQQESKPDERRVFRQISQARRKPARTIGAKSYYTTNYGRNR